jgi:CDP-paratose 2-epimerase
MRVLVTGGAGFVGANLTVGLHDRHPDWELVALDNLRRRGAELNLPRLRQSEAHFVHGDVRQLDDLVDVGPVDVIVECSAEPSALAGIDGSPEYVIKSNLLGAYNCLELARRHGAYLMFLSTSRVYPVAALNQLALTESESRFELAADQPVHGVSPAGIAEGFPLTGARTLYGSTKLAAELLIEEYRAAFGLRAVINRCGVVAGPWQMGKVDQGVFTHWMLAHHFGRPLSYIGFGGTGKQVRDLLHVDDLVSLIDEQVLQPERWDGVTANVGGGRECSLSLRETTALCAEITGRTIAVGSDDETRPGDVPLYLSDCTRLYATTGWRPQRGPLEILGAIHDWIREHEDALRTAL